MDDAGEGWQATVALNEALINPLGEVITVIGLPGLMLSELTLESGHIAKVLAGDMYCDGDYNAGDIDPFFLALGDPTAFLVWHSGCDPLNGDMNDGGRLDGADIDAFFECLGGFCP